MKTALWIIAWTTWTLALISMAAAIVLPGCETIRSIDAAIWRPAAPATGTAPEVPPPLLSIIAAGLATIGLPGMSIWLWRVKTNNIKTTASLAEELAALSARVDGLNKITALPPFPPV
jgi:hypothetical protein